MTREKISRAAYERIRGELINETLQEFGIDRDLVSTLSAQGEPLALAIERKIVDAAADFDRRALVVLEIVE